MYFIFGFSKQFIWMSCCSTEQDWSQYHVNSAIIEYLLKFNWLTWNYTRTIKTEFTSHLFLHVGNWPQSCSRISCLWRRLMVVVVFFWCPCFCSVHRLVGSVWGICPCACPGVPHRSLAAQVVLMSFLTASSRGRPSAQKRPIRAAWVRFWQTQSSFLHVHVPFTTTVAVSQRPFSLELNLVDKVQKNWLCYRTQWVFGMGFLM